MVREVLEILVNESRWIAPSVAFAGACGLWMLRGAEARRLRITAAMNVFLGVLIATLAFGHLLAVTLKGLMGTLTGSALVLYGIGVVLFVAGYPVARHGLALRRSVQEASGRTVALNAVLIVALLVTGPRNFPLAVPALLNIAYVRHRRPAVGWLIVGATILLFVGLLVGSVRFFLGGVSFEEFSGLPVAQEP